MEIRFHLTKASAELWLSTIDQALKSRYIDETGCLILSRLGSLIEDAADAEQAGKPSRPEITREAVDRFCKCVNRLEDIWVEKDLPQTDLFEPLIEMAFILDDSTV